MKITNQKDVTHWEIAGLPPGEYDLTVMAITEGVGQASKTVHESIPGPAIAAPTEPEVEA